MSNGWRDWNHTVHKRTHTRTQAEQRRAEGVEGVRIKKTKNEKYLLSGACVCHPSQGDCRWEEATNSTEESTYVGSWMTVIQWMACQNVNECLWDRLVTRKHIKQIECQRYENRWHCFRRARGFPQQFIWKFSNFVREKECDDGNQTGNGRRKELHDSQVCVWKATRFYAYTLAHRRRSHSQWMRSETCVHVKLQIIFRLRKSRATWNFSCFIILPWMAGFVTVHRYVCLMLTVLIAYTHKELMYGLS